MARRPTKEDLKWRAEMDASTLMGAEEIKADKQRLSAAQKEAKQKAEKLERVVANAKAVASKPAVKKAKGK